MGIDFEEFKLKEIRRVFEFCSITDRDEKYLVPDDGLEEFRQGINIPALFLWQLLKKKRENAEGIRLACIHHYPRTKETKK